jgi:hypothetical protein
MERFDDQLITPEFKRSQRTNIENMVTMLRSIRNTFGENVIRLAWGGYASLIRQRWRNICNDQKDRSIQALFGLQWEGSKKLISYEITNEDAKSLTLKVNSCFWAEEFKRLRATDIGYEYCCIPDFYVAEIFNPSIMYVQGKNIMRGDDSCIHSYAIGK